MTRLCVSIVTYNTPPHQLVKATQHLLSAIEHSLNAELISDFLIHFVDNSPGNGEPFESVRPFVARYPENFQFQHNQSNLGFGKAHNLVRDPAEFRLILNPDAYLDEDFLSVGLSHLHQHRSTVMTAADGRDREGKNLYLNKRYPSLLVLTLRALSGLFSQLENHRQNIHYTYQDLDHLNPFDVELASGCCMLMRQPDFLEIGGFDPNFFLYFEDFDLSIRLRTIGAIRYLPELKLIHDGGNTAKRGLSSQWRFTRAACQFFSKHGWRLV